jgi:hypothetical protein
MSSMEIKELSHDLDKIAKHITKLCENNVEVAQKYDSVVEPLTKAYIDTLGKEKFGYSAMFFGAGDFKFENGQEFYGHLLTIIYGPPGVAPNDEVYAHRHAFVLVLDKGIPVDFVEVKPKKTLH